ncbi:MAG: hypothetical protein QG671_4569 [Actinomycetota bacterium]|nr:hypothetical protein [Actinomycetota bacterium]
MIRSVDPGSADLGTIGFWTPSLGNVTWDPKQGWVANGTKILTSDEVGAGAFGLSAELINRYGRGWHLAVPSTSSPIPAYPRVDRLRPPDAQWRGQNLVQRPSSLFVKQGIPGVDPDVPAIPTPEQAKVPKGWGTQRGLASEPVNPPPWAKGTAKALGVAGAALTVAGAGYGQWQQDEKLHPEMSTGTKVQRAATTAVVEGGAAALGGWGGAMAGPRSAR